MEGSEYFKTLTGCLNSRRASSDLVEIFRVSVGNLVQLVSQKRNPLVASGTQSRVIELLQTGGFVVGGKAGRGCEQGAAGGLPCGRGEKSLHLPTVPFGNHSSKKYCRKVGRVGHSLALDPYQEMSHWSLATGFSVHFEKIASMLYGAKGDLCWKLLQIQSCLSGKERE